jgi:hypothetical protein
MSRTGVEIRDLCMKKKKAGFDPAFHCQQLILVPWIRGSRQSAASSFWVPVPARLSRGRQYIRDLHRDWSFRSRAP